MMKKILCLVLLSQLIISCGFTPIYKNSDILKNNQLIYYVIDDSISYEAKSILNKNLIKTEKEKAKFITKIYVNEKESTVNVLSSGSVSEYRIEVLINFTILEVSENKILYKSKSRGSANYDVSTSEYQNTLVKNEALKRALSEATQLMNILIQSKINE